MKALFKAIEPEDDPTIRLDSSPDPVKDTTVELRKRRRGKFLRRVIATLFFMFLITTAAVIAAVLVKIFKKALSTQAADVALFFCVVACIVTMCVLLCAKVARLVPQNYYLLFYFNLCYSYICAYVSIFYKSVVVAIAAGVTFLVALICLLIAVSQIDFTKYLLLLLLIALALLLASVLLVPLLAATNLHPVLTTIPVLIIAPILMALIITIQFQMAMGRKPVRIATKDYIIGALLIYVSIMNLYLLIQNVVDVFAA